MNEKIYEIIADQMKVAVESLNEQTHLVEDLKADSIDAAEIIITIENELDLVLDDQAIGEVRTIGDILEHIQKAKQASQ